MLKVKLLVLYIRFKRHPNTYNTFNKIDNCCFVIDTHKFIHTHLWCFHNIYASSHHSALYIWRSKNDDSSGRCDIFNFGIQTLELCLSIWRPSSFYCNSLFPLFFRVKIQSNVYLTHIEKSDKNQTEKHLPQSRSVMCDCIRYTDFLYF